MSKLISKFLIALMLLRLVPVPQAADASIYNTQGALNMADEFALEETFSPVGLFIGTDANGDEFIAGSGVLIHPYWVLTAGHVPFDEPGLYWVSMKFNLAANVGQNLDQFVDVASWHTYPGYNSDTPAGMGDDIGLVRLAKPIYDVVPAQRFYGDDQEGTYYRTAGYGKPGVWPNEGPFDGIRRAGENVADSFGRVFGVYYDRRAILGFRLWKHRHRTFLNGTPQP